MIAAIYSRKSRITEKGESVENQINLCKEYGKAVGITEFIVYEDDGFSGGNIERPQFQRMISDAKLKKFNYLICYRLDRISRNVSDFTKTIDYLKDHNIEFISIREQFDTSNPMGRAMMNIAAVFAQLERETIAERIKDNMLELSKTGRWLGGTAPLGFRSEAVEYSDGNGKPKKMFKLVEIPEEIEVVRFIFRLYLELKNFSSVASYLCRNLYKGKNGGEFSRQTVQQIVTNPVYCVADKKAFKFLKNLGVTIYGEPSSNGFMVYNKRKGGKKDKPINEWIFSVGQHNGIISSDTWIKCYKLNADKSSKLPSRSGTGNKFLLSGLIVCGCCGSGMSSWSRNNPKSGKYERYYRCNLKNRAANRCNNKMLNSIKAEENVIEQLKSVDKQSIIDNYKSLTEEFMLKNKTISEVDSIKKDIEKNNKTLQGLIRKIALLDDDPKIINLFKGEINKIKEENIELESKIKELQKDIDKSNEKQISLDEILKRLDNFKNLIDYADDITLKRKLITSIVESIVWHSESETLEVNLIGSGKIIPRGSVIARNLYFGSMCR